MESVTKKRLRKPNGVFLLSALVFLNFGVYQFINDFMAMRQGEIETPLLIATFLICVDVFSAASAIWAFLGDNAGRVALLILISLNFLWSTFWLITTISYAQPKADGFYEANIFLFGFSLLKPLTIFGLCWWYFTRKDVIAYYKQDNQYEFF